MKQAVGLGAARELFVAQGYASTTVAQIAERSGTPQSTVFRLFGSKRGILKEVLDTSLGGVFCCLTIQCGGDESAYERWLATTLRRQLLR